MSKDLPIIEPESFFQTTTVSGHEFFVAIVRIDYPGKEPIRFQIAGPDKAAVERKAAFISTSGHVPKLSPRPFSRLG